MDIFFPLELLGNFGMWVRDTYNYFTSSPTDTITLYGVVINAITAMVTYYALRQATAAMRQDAQETLFEKRMECIAILCIFEYLGKEDTFKNLTTDKQLPKPSKDIGKSNNEYWKQVLTSIETKSILELIADNSFLGFDSSKIDAEKILELSKLAHLTQALWSKTKYEQDGQVASLFLQKYVTVLEAVYKKKSDDDIRGAVAGLAAKAYKVQEYTGQGRNRRNAIERLKKSVNFVDDVDDKPQKEFGWRDFWIKTCDFILNVRKFHKKVVDCIKSKKRQK